MAILGERPLTPERARARLAELRRLPLNFDPADVGRPSPADGWHVDDLRQPLPQEPPGPPQPGQSWEVARQLLRHYKVADPSIVRAFYDASEPLEGRTMLLELRFWRLRFPVGVRVGEAYDEQREVDGRPARVSGWNYRTLAGHLEIGQMAWEVWKWEDSGDVEFHIHAFSRAAPTSSVLVRLGLRLFSRREQLRFYRHACARMLSLTVAGLSARAGGDPGVGLAPGRGVERRSSHVWRG